MEYNLSPKLKILNELTAKNKTLISITTLLYFLPLLTTNDFSPMRSTLFLLTTILIFGLLTLSFELQLGRNGLLNFGHAALFGVGAYTATFFLNFLNEQNLLELPTTNLGILEIPVSIILSSIWLIGIFLAILIGGFLGFVMGLTTSRMKGTSFAFIALAIAMVLFSIFAENSDLSGGETGLGVPIPLFYESYGIYIIFSLIMTPIILMLFISVIINDIRKRRGLVGIPLYPSPLKDLEFQQTDETEISSNNENRFEFIVLFRLLIKFILFCLLMLILLFFIIYEAIPNFIGMNEAPDFFFIIPVRYYFVLTSCLVTYIFVKKLTHSPFGRVISSISQNEERAKALGYNVYQYKIKTLIISGGIAGLAGALFAPTIGIIDPQTTLGVGITVDVMIYSIVGGLGTLFGPFLGAGLVIISEFRLAEILDVINITIFGIPIEGSWWVLILGAIYISIVLFFPFGIVGTIQVHSRNLIRRLRIIRITETDFWWIGFIIIIIIIGLIVNFDLYIDGLRDFLAGS